MSTGTRGGDEPYKYFYRRGYTDRWCHCMHSCADQLVASFPRRWQKPTDARPPASPSPDTCMTHATRALSEKTTTTSGICGRAVAAGNWYQLQILLPCSRWNLYVLHEPIDLRSWAPRRWLSFTWLACCDASGHPLNGNFYLFHCTV